MDGLQIFQNKEFGNVRAVVKDGEPWFIASDVCESLGLSNPTVSVNRLDADERSKFNLGRQGEVNTVNEYGLYNLVLGSRKPEAKAFKRWITHEVIPTIRKHGGYLTPDKVEEILTNPDAIIRLATQLKEERAKREAAEKVIEEQRPKALFADAVSASKTSILIGALAKLIRQNGVDVGQKRLFEWLRKKGYLIKSGNDKNMPTQRSMERGLFEVKEGSYVDGDGVNRITRTTKVTGKGQLYFVNKFLSSVRG